MERTQIQRNRYYVAWLRWFFVMSVLRHAEGCHFAQHIWLGKRNAEINDQTGDFARTRHIREFFSTCLFQKTSDQLEYWQSVVDFSILDTTWFQKFSQACVDDSGLDNFKCWSDAVSAFVSSKSFVYQSTLECVLEYNKLADNPASDFALDVNCTTRGWTPFFNRGSPNNLGDNESLSTTRQEFPGRVCNNPVAVDAKPDGLIPGNSGTNQVLNISVETGMVCENSKQANARCMDYMVRYCCPLDITSTCHKNDWTRYYSQGKPNELGEFESLSELRKIYSDICAYPSAIEATSSDGRDHRYTGQTLDLDLDFGLSCLHSNQPHNEKCLDYQVRFCCPSVKNERSLWYKYERSTRDSRRANKYFSTESIPTSGVMDDDYTKCLKQIIPAETFSERRPVQLNYVVQFIKNNVIYCDDDSISPCSVSRKNDKEFSWYLRLQAITKPQSIVYMPIMICMQQINVPVIPFTQSWGEWLPWGHCPALCGKKGTQLRRRPCLAGAPNIPTCIGPVNEIRECQPSYCPSGWGKWSSCFGLCSRSFRIRRKVCSERNFIDPVCRFPPFQRQQCKSVLCADRGGWSKWLSWSRCIASSCGISGQQRRKRICMKSNLAGSQWCSGPKIELKLCTRHCDDIPRNDKKTLNKT